jgi:hypothetical protein
VRAYLIYLFVDVVLFIEIAMDLMEEHTMNDETHPLWRENTAPAAKSHTWA